MDKGSVPLRRCLENCPHDSASHDRAKSNGSEATIYTQKCCNP